MCECTQTDLFALVDCIPTPVFVLDVRADGVPVYAHYNANALGRLDRDLDSIVGRTTVEAFGEEFGTAAYNEQCKTIAQAKPRKYEFQLPVGNEVRVVRTSLYPQLDADGKVVRLIGSASDVSLEWIAQTAQAKLDHIGTEVEQFIAMAAHDLRTPMRNVMSLADMLAEDFEDRGDGKTELIALLKQTAHKSMNLISDVLSYANAIGPAGGNTLYRLDALCRDIMATLDPHDNHTMRCTDIPLSGEKNVMQVILRNLVDNALKHGKRDRMTLMCKATMQDTGFVKITISDDGNGFANPGTVFLESGDFRIDSGYGLLAIRKLILARGGTIGASNDIVTGGSCVTFTLPSDEVVPKIGDTQHLLAQNSAKIAGDKLHS